MYSNQVQAPRGLKFQNLLPVGAATLKAVLRAFPTPHGLKNSALGLSLVEQHRV